jgi:amino acid transporter
MLLALILSEFASDPGNETGGIYSYMSKGLGPTWAFVGTWSYFVSNLIYLQVVFADRRFNRMFHPPASV